MEGHYATKTLLYLDPAHVLQGTDRLGYSDSWWEGQTPPHRGAHHRCSYPSARHP
jgi:hypothetical protein